MRIISHEAPDVWYERVDGEIRIHETESDRVISAPMDMAMRVLMFRKPIMTEIAKVIDHKERPCVICGNKFVSRFTKVSTCSEECRKARTSQKHKEYRDRHRTAPKRKANVDRISETAKAARDTGLTYGQYKAQETIEMYGRLRMTFHFMFEQSGTFKNEAKKLGYEAYDYDIKNNFGETDHIVDLFGQIETAFLGGYSVFDEISPDDVVIAFFPCIRFSEQNILNIRANNYGMKNWTLEQKLIYGFEKCDEMAYFFKLISKLVVVALRKRLKLIIENPYGEQHFLTRYWCLQPKVIDHNRRENGDYYKKPTQYFFVNLEPKNNFIFEPIEWVDAKRIEFNRNQVERSLIHPQYANRFLRRYVI